MKYLFLPILLFTASVRAQNDFNVSILQNIDTTHPDLSKGSCSFPNGPMLELPLVAFDHTYLMNNGYCYTGYPTTSTVTMCFTFTAPTSSVNLDAGYSESCNTNTFGPFRLYKTSDCSLVTSSLSPSGLIVGASYTWCVTMRAYGGGSCTGYTTFCPYFTRNIVLPLEFIDLKATCDRLTWQTASEDNVSHFVIEHSMDGNKWEPIGTEIAMGFSTELSSYSFDITPSSGVNYYQLWEYDFNGKMELLKTVSVQCASSKTIEAIYAINGKYIGNKIPSSKGAYIIMYSDGTTEKIIN